MAGRADELAAKVHPAGRPECRGRVHLGDGGGVQVVAAAKIGPQGLE